MNKWELVATLIEPMYSYSGTNGRYHRGGGTVHHVYISVHGMKMRCGSCRIQPIKFDASVMELPRAVGCQHMRALYIVNAVGFATVNLTARGREIFHAVYAARALEDS